MRTTTFAPACSINRYYDPSTDQFLSVDPDVQTTDQPYAFVNDNPLNSEDPLGLVPSAGTGQTNTETLAIAMAYAAEKARDAVQLAKEVAATAKELTQKIVVKLAQQFVEVSGNSAGAVTTVITKSISDPNNPITPSETSTIDQVIADGAESVSNVAGAVGSVITAYNNTLEGENPAAAIAGATFSWGAAIKGGESAAEVCAEEGPIASALCGFGGGLATGGIVNWAWHEMMNS
jgi:uncharacterized protein RhaS with RHS repeats